MKGYNPNYNPNETVICSFLCAKSVSNSTNTLLSNSVWIYCFTLLCKTMLTVGCHLYAIHCVLTVGLNGTWNIATDGDFGLLAELWRALEWNSKTKSCILDCWHKTLHYHTMNHFVTILHIVYLFSHICQLKVISPSFQNCFLVCGTTTMLWWWHAWLK